MRRLIVFLLLGLFITSMIPAKDKFKNLQLLEFETEKELKTFMEGMANDLGVKCKFCHDMNDKSFDTKHKKIARGMLNMVANLNTGPFSWSEEPKISCWTCHRGEKEPPAKRP